MKPRHLPMLFFLMVIVFSLVATGTITGSSKTSAAGGNSGYIGSEQCAVCHYEKYASWNETGHANAAGQINETHYWVGNPYVIRNATDFASSCARCHTTGYVYNETDPGSSTWFDLGIQCERCHGADTMSLPEEQRIDYSASLCGQCHTQYGDWQQSAHNNSLTTLLASDHAADYCLRCHSVQSFVDYYNFSMYVEDVIGEINITNPKLDPNTCALCHNPHSAEYEHQLRFENSTELCSKCHSSPPYVTTYDMWKTGPFALAGMECANCHGQGTRLFHGEEESWYNHTFFIYNTFYPYNQTEPMVCSTCHTGDTFDWAVSQLNTIQGLTMEAIANVTQAITEAEAAITAANQTSGVDVTIINQAAGWLATAESHVTFVENDHSEGFHNPELSYELLINAALLANSAKALAQEARAEALGQTAADLETTITGLQTTITDLETKVSDLEGKVSGLEANQYLFLGGGLVIGLVIGALILYAFKRKPT